MSRNTIIAIGLALVTAGCWASVAASGRDGRSVRAAQPEVTVPLVEVSTSTTLTASPPANPTATVDTVVVTAPTSVAADVAAAPTTMKPATSTVPSSPATVKPAAPKPVVPVTTVPKPVVPVTTAPKPVVPVTTAPAATTPPVTAPPTTAAPVRTIGACQNLGSGPVNDWRAELGKPALTTSGGLYSAACTWATHLASTNMFTHGSGGEVMFKSGAGCNAAFAAWRGSSGHYAVLTGNVPTSIGVACVTDSNGTSWVVGRVAG